MTVHKATPPAGAELHLGTETMGQFIRRRRRILVAAGLDGVRRAVPFYAELPEEQMGTDIAAAAERGLQLVISALEDGHASEALLEQARESSARRAEEGVPLDMVVRAYMAAAASVIQEIVASTTAEDLDDFVAALAIGLDVVGQAVAAATAGYIEESRAIVGQAASSQRALLSALVGGRRPDDGGVTLLAPRYAVARLAVGRHPDEDDEGVASSVAGRRKVRRILSALDTGAHRPTLEALSPEGGLVLLPGDDDDQLWADLGRRVDDAATAAGAPLTVTAEVTGPDGVPEAAALVEELLALTLALGRPPGVHRLDDLVVEYQLTRPGPGRRALAQRIAPLADHPDLLATVRTHLAAGLDRRRTATEMHLHPNSVDYRLKRVTTLTGLDAASRAAAWEVGTALVAWDAERSAGG